MAKTIILASDGATFSFQEIRYRVKESRVDSAPHPSPNRVLKFCESNCLAKTSIMSSDGASFSVEGLRYRVIEKRVDSAPRRSLYSFLKFCWSNCLEDKRSFK